MAEMHFYTVEQMDETGCDKRDHIRQFGYAMKGEQPSVLSSIFASREKISAVSAMCTTGVIALEVHEGTLNGEKFTDFIAGTF